MKSIYKDRYAIFGIVNGKVKSFPEMDLEEVKKTLKELNFRIDDKLKFEKETRKKDVVGWTVENDPIFKDTLIGIFEPELFIKNNTNLSVNKFRYYSQFDKELYDDESLFYLDMPELYERNDRFSYFITSNDRVLRLNNKSNSVIEMTIEKDRDRMEIMGERYKIDYIISKKGKEYIF